MPALQWFDVSELAKAHEAFLLATKERATSTASDLFSSRSQCLFLFGVEQKIRNPPPGCPATRRRWFILSILLAVSASVASRDKTGRGDENESIIDDLKFGGRSPLSR
jgi:hypothetical protein